MDIGRPNNFPRIMTLHNDDYEAIQSVCWGASFSDKDTERHLRKVYTETGYVMCPHTAVGHLAMDSFADGIDEDFIKVTVATAHPAKFNDSVERILREKMTMPPALAEVMTRTPNVHNMAPTVDALAAILDAASA